MKHTFLALLSLTLVACGGGTQPQETPEISIEGNTFTVSGNSPILQKIVTQHIEKSSFQTEFQTVGNVRAIAGQLAEVAVPFDGRIVSSSVSLGQKVGRGTTLFTFRSTDFLEASKNYFQAKKSYELAQKNLARKKKLLEGGIAAQRDVEEAETEAALAEAEYQQAENSMGIFGVHADKLSMGQALAVTSPIAGEVVRCETTIGQYVKADDEALVTVANLDKVWVVAQLKEHYFGTIEKGDTAEVFCDSQPENAIQGIVRHIGDILDEETRSAEVLVECENSKKNLKPGMFASIHFQCIPLKAIVIPNTALFQDGDATTVFVAKGNGVFERRIVRTNHTEGSMACIEDGLQEGEEIVVEGGIFLKR